MSLVKPLPNIVCHWHIDILQRLSAVLALKLGDHKMKMRYILTEAITMTHLPASRPPPEINEACIGRCQLASQRLFEIYS